MAQYVGTLLYGSGFDGDCHIDANPFDYTSPGDGNPLIVANVLQRPPVFNSLVVDAGCVLDAAYDQAGTFYPLSAIRSTVRIVNQGTIQLNAPASSGFTAGLVGTSGLEQNVGFFQQAANGGTGDGPDNLVSGDIGGDGGTGGAGTGHPGGGVAIVGPIKIHAASSLLWLFSMIPLYGGTAGGPGGGDNVQKGGAGGCGGSPFLIAAPLIDNHLGTISAKGGDGGTPTLGNTGGGGGGGGGAIILCFSASLEDATYVPDDLGTLDVAAGAAGAGHGTGTAADAAVGGNVFLHYVPIG